MLNYRGLGPRPGEIYFRLPIGPLKVRYRNVEKYGKPPCKMEACCHVCLWSTFEWTLDVCHQKILKHVFDAHSPIPKPASNDRLPPPG